MEELSVSPISVLFAESLAPGDVPTDERHLTFRVLVANLGQDKEVDIHWADSHGRWAIAPAQFVARAGSGEIWEVRAGRPRDRHGPHPVEFAASVRAQGREWWDNNDGANYRLAAATGDVVLGRGIQLANLRGDVPLCRHRTTHAVAVAVVKSLHPRGVYVRWTTDQWRTYTETPCHIRRWTATGAVHPSHHAASVWEADLPVDQATRVEYAIRCETAGGEQVWDNAFGTNYVAQRQRLRVLTLNLHCYQEENWDAKLSQIARAIDDHDVDIVCLQEVAEPWTSGQPDDRGNAARLIRDRLKRHYHLTNDWSHLGFGVYREGSAILSRHDVLIKDSGYVSTSRDPYDIHARKIVMVQVDVPCLGAVNVFSTHLSWWADGFKTQFENLRRWADERHTEGIAATLLCGDFNSDPASDGYRLATDGGEYEDQYRKVHRKAGLNGDVANGTDRRIDYIFLKRGSALEAVGSKVMFTASDYGSVSDHPGYYAEFELPV